MKRLAITVCAALLCAASMLSCSSNKPIPDDMTAKELIQRGQEAFERNKSKEALRYFNAVVDRYGKDPARYVEARYEIAHIYMRKKNYEAALPILEELTDLFAYYPVGMFPAAYEKLAKIELAKIPEAKVAEIHAKNAEKAEKLARAQQEAELQAQLQQETEIPPEDVQSSDGTYTEESTAEEQSEPSTEQTAAE